MKRRDLKSVRRGIRKMRKDERRNEKRRGNIWNRDVEQIVEST